MQLHHPVLWPDGLASRRRGIPVAYDVTQCPQAVDADLDDVARREEFPVRGSDALGRARRDHVAGLEGDSQRAGLDQLGHGEDELRGELRLHLLAVQVGGEVELGEVESRSWGQHEISI